MSYPAALEKVPEKYSEYLHALEQARAEVLTQWDENVAFVSHEAALADPQLH